MCHDPQSSPPIFDEPVTGATGADFVLKSDDGSELLAYRARPEQPSGVGIVVFPDARGLHDFYRHLGLKLAEQGHDAIVIDYFGRTAGTEVRPSGVAFEDTGFNFMEHMGQLTNAGLESDFAAAVAELRSTSGCSSVFSIGFCIGGRSSYLSAARGHELAGSIGFYGTLGEMRGLKVPVVEAHHMSNPVLALQSARDTDPDRYPVDAFKEALTAHGVEHELVLYDAPHSFFDIKFDEYADVCADAWSRVKGFISAHS